MEKESSRGYLKRKKNKITFLYQEVLLIQIVEISDNIIRKSHSFIFLQGHAMLDVV